SGAAASSGGIGLQSLRARTPPPLLANPRLSTWPRVWLGGEAGIIQSLVTGTARRVDAGARFTKAGSTATDCSNFCPLRLVRFVGLVLGSWGRGVARAVAATELTRREGSDPNSSVRAAISAAVAG